MRKNICVSLKNIATKTINNRFITFFDSNNKPIRCRSFRERLYNNNYMDGIKISQQSGEEARHFSDREESPFYDKYSVKLIR